MSVEELIKKSLLNRSTNKFNKDGEEYKTSTQTANTYINYLRSLSGQKPLKNLNFLEDFDDVINKIESRYKSIYTKKTVVSAIISILKLLGTDYDKLISQYSEQLRKYVKYFKENVNTNEKSKKQEENWVSQEEIENERKKLIEHYEKYKNRKWINKRDYSKLLDLLILLLYTDIATRRRKDYIQCYFADDDTDVMDKSKNFYYDNMFIFNNYKTSQTNGQQILEIHDDSKLREVIATYIKFHPLLDTDKKPEDIPFLVTYSGLKFHPKYINVALESIFNKKVGPSLLRSIYVSHHLGESIDEIKEKAEEMGTSVNKLINVYNKD